MASSLTTCPGRLRRSPCLKCLKCNGSPTLGRRRGSRGVMRSSPFRFREANLHRRLRRHCHRFHPSHHHPHQHQLYHILIMVQVCLSPKMSLSGSSSPLVCCGHAIFGRRTQEMAVKGVLVLEVVLQPSVDALRMCVLRHPALSLHPNCYSRTEFAATCF